jgi:hypothetical protein
MNNLQNYDGYINIPFHKPKNLVYTTSMDLIFILNVTASIYFLLEVCFRS